MGRLIRTTYNFSPSFCYFVPNYAATMLEKDYNKDTIDLSELDRHNEKCIEHDASLCRECHVLLHHLHQSHTHTFYPSIPTLPGVRKLWR